MEKAPLYYVPDQSKLPIFASIGLFLTVFGLASWLNEIKSVQDGNGRMWFIMGIIMFIFIIYTWFKQVVIENRAGLNSEQLKRSFVWAMGWFIFSEVMFFAAFFGALYYIRDLAIPWLSSGPTEELLWPGFQEQWPLMETPDMAANGDKASVFGPEASMANPGISNWLSWLPFWNTVVLLTSSVTVHFAHTALKKDNMKKFNIFLGVTVVLGIFFLFLQVEEYIEAYNHLGLKIDSGIYGTTFFMLTGFHGLHVFMGTLMLLIQWIRSVYKKHFTHSDCFGFEASSWYWHFVDVVWVGLFLFVYVLS